MKLKSLLLLAVAVGCGLVAMLGVQQVLSAKKGDGPATAQILVAKTDIPPGALLDDRNVEFRQWPAEAIPSGAVTSEEEYRDRALVTRAVAGEPIMLAKLGDKGAFRASSEIPEGMQVVSISVDETKTHSGQILPGDYVDVIVNYKRRVPGVGTVSKVDTVLEYVKVFSTGGLRDVNVADQPEVKAKNISLLVTPEHAKELILAQSMGTITLALRPLVEGLTFEEANKGKKPFSQRIAELDQPAESSEEDTQPAVAESEPSDVKSFLDAMAQPNGDAQEPAETVAAKLTWQIEIFSGGERRVEEVELPDDEQTEEALMDSAAAGTTQDALTSASTSGGNPFVDMVTRIFQGL